MFLSTSLPEVSLIRNCNKQFISQFATQWWCSVSMLTRISYIHSSSDCVNFWASCWTLKQRKGEGRKDKLAFLTQKLPTLQLPKWEWDAMCPVLHDMLSCCHRSSGECGYGLVENPETESGKCGLRFLYFCSQFLVDCKILLEEQGWCNVVHSQSGTCAECTLSAPGGLTDDFI